MKRMGVCIPGIFLVESTREKGSLLHGMVRNIQGISRTVSSRGWEI
jgi:hypothetical protein